MRALGGLANQLQRPRANPWRRPRTRPKRFQLKRLRKRIWRLNRLVRRSEITEVERAVLSFELAYRAEALLTRRRPKPLPGQEIMVWRLTSLPQLILEPALRWDGEQARTRYSEPSPILRAALEREGVEFRESPHGFRLEYFEWDKRVQSVARRAKLKEFRSGRALLKLDRLVENWAADLPGVGKVLVIVFTAIISGIIGRLL